MFDSLTDERDALRKALCTLVNLYVANKGTKSEFIICITPKSAWQLTEQQRKDNKVWAAWDAARSAITQTSNKPR